MFCSILESFPIRGGVNSEDYTRGGFNSKGHTRGGVNSDHTANGVSTKQGAFRISIVVILVCSILESIRTRCRVNSEDCTKGGVNSKGCTRGGVNPEDCTRSGVNFKGCTRDRVNSEVRTRLILIILQMMCLQNKVHLEQTL